MQQKVFTTTPLLASIRSWRMSVRLLVPLALMLVVAGCVIPPPAPRSASQPVVAYNTHDHIAPPIVPAADYLDIPESARGPAIDPQKGYFVEEIRDGLYWVTEGAYQMTFLTTGEGVIVVDAPPTIGEKILTAIAEVTDEPITHVIYSHTHIDHIGAAYLYPKTAQIIAQAETAAQLIQANDPNRPVPTVTFTDSYTLQVGAQVLELAYPGNNHEPGNIFIYAPKQKVMTLIDIIFPGWMPWRRLAVAEDIPGYFRMVALLQQYDFDTIVAGHVGRLGTRTDVEVQWAFLQDLRAAALAGLQSVPLPEVIQAMKPEDTANPWAIFDGYIDRVVQHCVDQLAPEWSTQLAAFDVFIYDQCLAMEQSLRID